jgi:hypothetical protein
LNLPQNLTADAADALAVALCLAHSLPWQASLSSFTGQRSFSKMLRSPSAKRPSFGDVL